VEVPSAASYDNMEGSHATIGRLQDNGMTSLDRSAVMEKVEACWRALFDRLGVDAGAAGPTLAELVGAYSEEGRHYHTLDHIAALLHLLDRHGQGLVDRKAVELAVFFHDAVYVPTRSDNEAQSAALARARLTALGLPAALVARVADLILATRHGTEHAEPHDADMALLVDLDLSVLAADRPVYAAYAQAIRSEYAVYPDVVYLPGRRHVLGQFLARPRIYRTSRLHELWDAAARANLTWELAELG
jgi:predicted metal-dependent HD superfamily phosphohydrolase